MASRAPLVPPDRFTGLPSGVRVASVGRRLLAFAVEALPALALLSVLLGPARGSRGGVVLTLLLLAAWGLVVWWMTAKRAAGPGYRLTRLQVVGFLNGRPIGWARALVRALVFSLLLFSVVGWVVMVILLLRHPRQQGWHDLVAGAVVIEERVLAPRFARPDPTSTSSPTPVTTPDVPAGTSPLPPSSTATLLPAAPSGPEVGLGATAPVAGPPLNEPMTAPSPEPAWDEQAAAEPVGWTTPAEADLATRMMPRVGTPEPAPVALWTVEFDSGQQVDVEGLVLVGRNPQPRSGEQATRRLAVPDPGRTVSKSHLALDLDGDTLVVTDRGSTNGTTVTSPDGEVLRCPAEQPVALAEGSVVSIGGHWFTVRRRPAG